MTKVTDSESPAAGDGLFRSLSPHIGAFDEMTGEDGRIRDHWSHLVKAFTKHGAMEIKARSDNADRILREHGVTYNVYGEAGSIDRPWGVDVAPFLLPASEWERIEAALIQRSRLLNRIMEDLYGGGQRLLRNGFLPPELVYSNPGFLRPCRGIPVPRQVYLHLLACDMVRSASGQWSVLSDRAQAPSGAGYALENRSVLSRVLPDEIRESSVRRLPEFFRRQREMLSALAPEGCQDPNVIVLTPGPRNETYFEHAYLARSLGFTLAEGADLTVRNQRVYLKTVEGLQAVDVILRRLDDAFCDPLELRSDSFLGVAGLVEATRAGTVTLANALGSALVESAAFLPFLEPISRLLLDQELLLPCVPTWWCGRARDLRHVLSQLDSMVVKPAFRTHRSGPWFGGRLSKVELSDLKERIEASPRDFIAQEMVSLSVAPAWIGQAYEPRGVVL
ncbi:MAG: circularly permuted type 2 ATP-grasp protein, partial [Verrucomicrobia bacterium]|nr:circularly permuted type 2 ATP-grasp protein [Verrucomicrobiota bacterium]